STPRRPRAPWLSASCSCPATGTRPVARCASTVGRRAPTCSRRRPGSRAAVQAHDMTTEISGEELRERMRAVLKDCAARHSKSEKQVCEGYSFDSAKEKRCYRPVGVTPVLSSEINKPLHTDFPQMQIETVTEKMSQEARPARSRLSSYRWPRA